MWNRKLNKPETDMIRPPQARLPTLPIFPGESWISVPLPKISRAHNSHEFLPISTRTTILLHHPSLLTGRRFRPDINNGYTSARSQARQTEQKKKKQKKKWVRRESTRVNSRMSGKENSRLSGTARRGRDMLRAHFVCTMYAFFVCIFIYWAYIA